MQYAEIDRELQRVVANRQCVGAAVPVRRDVHVVLVGTILCTEDRIVPIPCTEDRIILCTEDGR